MVLPSPPSNSDKVNYYSSNGREKEGTRREEEVKPVMNTVQSLIPIQVMSERETEKGKGS